MKADTDNVTPIRPAQSGPVTISAPKRLTYAYRCARSSQPTSG